MKISKFSVILLVAFALLASTAFFTVHEREKAILFQLGKLVRADYKPGLHFKIPMFQNIIKFDGRIQTLDAEPELFLTSEKKNVLVDSFVKWRIGNVETFYKSTGGSIEGANDRLGNFIKKGLKDEFGQRTISDVVSGNRTKMMQTLMVKPVNGSDGSSLVEKAAELGMEIIDVRLKRVDFSDKISSSVYRRMQAERERVAREHRSKGHEQAKIIRANAEKDREVTLANAEKDAQTLRGEGDGIAAQIYADAYKKDAEFYSFYRSLNAYKGSFKDRSDVLLLGTENEFFRFFTKPGEK